MAITSLEEFQNQKMAAVDWQYLVVKSGGMARKSELDAWLMRRYDIDAFSARNISNAIDVEHCWRIDAENHVSWDRTVAGRPEPRFIDYPDLKLGEKLGKV